MPKEPKNGLTGRNGIPSPRTLEELAALLRESIPDAITKRSMSAKAFLYVLRKMSERDEKMPNDCQYAPQIQGYIDMRKRNNYAGWGTSYSYDAKTYELVNELFAVLGNVQPSEVSLGRKVWRLWLKADRGPIAAFGDFQEMQECGDVETYEEYEELWKELCPNESSWFSFAAVEDPDISYRGIFLDHKLVLESSPMI